MLTVHIWRINTGIQELSRNWIHAKRHYRAALRVFYVCRSTDSTATVVVIRKGFSRTTQDVYALPIEISDNGVPPLSSTNTLLIRVCSCDAKHTILSCNVEPLFLPAGLSTGALIAILACIVILLGNAHHTAAQNTAPPAALIHGFIMNSEMWTKCTI